MIATSSAIPIGSGVREIETWSPMSADLASEFEYIDIAAIDREQKVITATARTRASDAPSRARQIVQRGDVLVSTVRPALNAVAVVPASLDGAIASTGFTVLRSDERRLHGPYLFHWVRGTAFIDEMVRLATGASYPAVSDRIIKASCVPVPFPDDPRRSLAEQKRIAAILDKADAIRRRRQEAARLADTLGSSLFVDRYQPYFRDPEHHRLAPLEECCEKITDGVHITPTYVTDGVPFLRITDIKNGVIDWRSVRQIPQVEYDEIVRRTRPGKGDVLYSKNGTIGLPIEVTWDHDFAHFVSLARLTPHKHMLDSTFLCTFLGTELALRQATSHSKTLTVTNLHLVEIRKMLIPCPPLREQQEFVRAVKRGKEAASAIAKAATQADALFNALVQRAFRGEL